MNVSKVVLNGTPTIRGMHDQMQDVITSLRRHIDLSDYSDGVGPVRMNMSIPLRLCLFAGLCDRSPRSIEDVMSLNLPVDSTPYPTTFFSKADVGKLFEALLKLRYHDVDGDWGSPAFIARVIGREILRGRDIVLKEGAMEDWLLFAPKNNGGAIGDIPENVPVNKQKLADAVKEAVNKLGEDTYTADSFKAMIAAINEGISILADENATQETIDNACANVLDVMSKLTKKDGGNTNPTSAAGLKAGDEFVVKGNTYRVISPEKLTVAFVKAKNAKSVTVPATVIKGNKFKVIQISSKAFKAKKIKTVTIGKNIAKIKKNAFKGSKAKKINLKTKRLKKNSIKGCLKGSKVKSIKVKISKKKSTNKKYINKYKKIFTKKNAGRKVKVY